jgi:hypothetical protein
MAVGDSFVVPVPEGGDAQTVQKRLSSNAWNFCRRTPGFRFVTRIVDGGRAVRCWRAQLLSLLEIVPAIPAAVTPRVHTLGDDEPEQRAAGGRQ